MSVWFTLKSQHFTARNQHHLAGSNLVCVVVETLTQNISLIEKSPHMFVIQRSMKNYRLHGVVFYQVELEADLRFFSYSEWP